MNGMHERLSEAQLLALPIAAAPLQEIIEIPSRFARGEQDELEARLQVGSLSCAGRPECLAGGCLPAVNFTMRL